MDTIITDEKHALRRAAQILGGQAALAAACGYPDRRHVSPYFKTGRAFPAEKAPAVERATREKGTPVRCEELCPGVDWAVLRCQPGV